MIMITAEYLPGILNKEADWESRNVRDFSEWKLKPQMFMNLCKIVGSPIIDLFASRLSNQIPVYFSWKPDPYCLGVDAMQQEWPHNQILYAFPPFSMINRVLKKVVQDQVLTLILIAPTWQSQVWYPQLIRLSRRNPILLPPEMDLLKGVPKRNHPLLENKTLTLAAWIVSGRVCSHREYQSGLQILSLHQEDRVRMQITRRPGISDLAGLIENRLIRFDVM